MSLKTAYALPAAIALVITAVSGLSLPPDVEHALDAVAADSFKAHVAFLADDALQGREPNTDGYEMAARYVETQYRRLGVEPAGDDGTYRQTVRLRSAQVDTVASVLTILVDGVRHTLAYADDFVLLPNFSTERDEVEAQLVFAGYGVSAPDQGHDDYKDLDVQGKIVLLVNGAPDRGFDHVVRSTLGQRGTKLATAARHGAIGVVFAYPARPWNRVVNFARRPVWGAVLPDGSNLSRSGNPHPELGGLALLNWQSVAPLLADTSFTRIESLHRAASDPNSPQPSLNWTVHLTSSSRFEESTSPNIVGVLPGADPELKNSFVVHSAHLDHVGIGRPVEGDSVYNGAHDNASGVASVLEIARVYAGLEEGSRPRRSVIFLMVTAEELGLLGSAYFANNPTVPRDQIVTNINTDMPTLIAPLRSIVPLGAEHSSLIRPVKYAADYLGLEITDDHMPEQVRFVRSDHYSFVQQGIPALHVKYGLKSDDPENDLKTAIDTFTKEYYHKPADQIDAPFDFEAARTYVRLNFLIGYQVAMADEQPTWNEGDWFARYVK